MTLLLDPPVRQSGIDTQSVAAHGGTVSGRNHEQSAAQIAFVPVGPDFPEGQLAPGTQPILPFGDLNAEMAANRDTAPTELPRPSLFDPTLSTLAALLDDIEGVRKASANRVRVLTATEPDQDGIIRGFGLTADHPAVGILAGLGDQLAALEHQVILAVQRAMRKHPLVAWQKQAKGVGEKQLARLLAAIGDPYIATRQDGTESPRTVSQLWAYCGLHTLPTGRGLPDTHPMRAGGATTSPEVTTETLPLSTASTSSSPGDHAAAKRQKGVKANWTTAGKTRAYLIATSAIKQPASEYRAVYDHRRQHTAETHPDWTPGHSHNDALRVTAKRILRDLWRAARDYHEGADR